MDDRQTGILRDHIQEQRYREDRQRSYIGSELWRTDDIVEGKYREYMLNVRQKVHIKNRKRNKVRHRG